VTNPLLSELSSFPDTARQLVLGAIDAQGPDDPVLGHVVAHHLELAGELATAHLVLPSSLVRVQVRRDGAYQRTVVPASQVLRVDELSEGGQLTVVVELNADRTALALVAATIDGRFEAEGAMTRGGWVLTAAAAQQARLSEFAAALRSLVLH